MGYRTRDRLAQKLKESIDKDFAPDSGRADTSPFEFIGRIQWLSFAVDVVRRTGRIITDILQQPTKGGQGGA